MTGVLGPRLALGERLIAQAMAEAADAFRTPGAAAARTKTPGDLVTEADLRIEALLRRGIAAAFPADAILAEESGGALGASGAGWLIDPIDGTVNFARGIRYFCVSLALVTNGAVAAAWVADPLAGEVFFAGPAPGAFRNGEPLPRLGAPREAGAPVVVGMGFSPRHPGALAGRIPQDLADAGYETRRLGAGALCLAHVAAGRLDAYAEPHMNPWDGAGGLYIARSAGAVTLDYARDGGLHHGGPVFAAAPEFADRLLGLLPAPFSGVPRMPDPRPAPGRILPTLPQTP